MGKSKLTSKHKGKLSFGEKMREWRRAKKEFFEEVKKRLKEKQEIEDNHLKVKPEVERKVIINAPAPVEIKTDVRNSHPIDAAIARLREKAQGV